MRIAAYQFEVTSDINKNFEYMEKAIREAKDRRIELLVFPECAQTGYPPRDMEKSSLIDFDLTERFFEQLIKLSEETKVAIIFGTAFKKDDEIYNRAVFVSPEGSVEHYDKRALWGWDRDNFAPGNEKGIVEYKGFKIGIRICFEIRFPEYFRELYKENTDLNAVLFYDVSDKEDTDRYELIKGNMRTRAAENVCTFISANSIRPYQTAPTAIIGRSGQILDECVRNTEGFAEYDLEKKEYDFGEKGRKEISDILTIS